MADFEELSREAERRGIGLMLDMVFNHTSTQHEWFQKAWPGTRSTRTTISGRKAGRMVPLPPTWESKFGGSAWEYVSQFDEYYLHLLTRPRRT